MDNNSIGTTVIESLPTAEAIGQENIQLTTKDLSENSNVIVDNAADRLQEQRQLDQNEFVKGLQQAASTGSTSLPSRDIPIDKTTITQDKQTKPNFVPEGPSDYITEHQTSDEIIRQNSKVQQQQDQFDAIYSEISLPLLIAVLYFIYQLPAVRKMFLNTMPMCYGKSGDINLSGRLVNCILFGAIIYGFSKLVQQLSR
tara:strand:- start:9813 stop:10409 length:597 start_codon:yes stop_codon:yes gene_type:complete